MADETLLSGWWKRFRGKLEPTPCPFSVAGVLENPLRRLVASPERVLGAFGLGAGEIALEIGPGIGYYSLEAARRLGTNGRLICLDIQRDMVLELQRRVDNANVAADCIEASALDLPLNSGAVDHVLLIGVLGEFPDRATALTEIHRVLRPGGRISVSEQMPDPDFMTKGTLRRELTAAGFSRGEDKRLALVHVDVEGGGVVSRHSEERRIRPYKAVEAAGTIGTHSWLRRDFESRAVLKGGTPFWDRSFLRQDDITRSSPWS